MRRGNNSDKNKNKAGTFTSNNNPVNYTSPAGNFLNPKAIVNLSKKLSYLLRHGAIKEGIAIDTSGFLLIDDILAHIDFKTHNLEQIKIVVDQNDKKRFELVQIDPEDETKGYKIRAVQGHSITVIEDENIFDAILDPNEYPCVVHGTDLKAWTNFIRFSGLRKMGRTHIHFAKGFPGDHGVISGMRQACQIVIEIDMVLALKDGFKFFKSKNDVILCAGKGDDGQIPPKYFSQVYFRQGDKLVPIKPKHFEYLLVLDFEANCVKEGALECQEIIEFPVVPINSADGSAVCDPFHFYIKPTVVPEITEFCTELTGIHQSTVDAGITIDKCLIALNDWMNQNGFTLENSTFVTCGMWDLKTCLRSEATYKKLAILPYLKKFINIKDIWMHTFLKTKSPGMAGMLTSLNLKLEGKHHSGIDDSKNIAKMAWSLIEKGGVFTQFQEILVRDKDSKKEDNKNGGNKFKTNKNPKKGVKNGNPLND